MPKQKSPAPAASGAGPTLTGSLKSNNPPTPKMSMPQQPKMDASPQGYALMMSDPLKASLYPKPDDSAYATNVQRMRDVYDITTNAAGEAAAAFGCALSAGTYPAMTITASAVTALGTAVNSQWLTALTNENAQYRTLCYVVEWKPSMSAMAGTGAVFLGTYPNTTSANASGVPLQALSAYFDDIGATGPAVKPACLVSRPVAAPGFGTMAATQSGAFTETVFVCSGLPAGVVVGKIHVTRIFELEPLSGSMSALSATYSPCDMTACCVGANILGPASSYSAGEDKPYERVVGAAVSIAKKALGAYVNYSSGGAMALARMFM